MRTALTLDDDVYSKLEEEVRKTGKPFEKVVNELLRRALVLDLAAQKTKPFKVRSWDLGSRPGLNYDNIGDLLERLEAPRAIGRTARKRPTGRRR